MNVATVLTVYGIETNVNFVILNKFYAKLQQYLPFTVLKRSRELLHYAEYSIIVATVLTVYGIETAC